MLNFSEGIFLIQDIISRVSSGVKAPFLLPSRVAEDLHTMRQNLELELQNLSLQETRAAMPVFLNLLGYEVLRDQTIHDICLWEIRQQDYQNGLLGFAILGTGPKNSFLFQQLLEDDTYTFGLFVDLAPPDSLSLERPNNLNYMGLPEISLQLMAIVVNKYIETFSLSIGAIPGIKEQLQLVLQTELSLSWVQIKSALTRWDRLTNQYDTIAQGK